MRTANLIRLHTAVFHFTKTPDCTAQELSEITGVGVKTVYGWVKRPEWNVALDALNFTGQRAFARNPTREPLRDAGGLVEQAFEIYKRARQEERTQKHAVSIVVAELNLSRWRVNTWARRYGWEKRIK